MKKYIWVFLFFMITNVFVLTSCERSVEIDSSGGKHTDVISSTTKFDTDEYFPKEEGIENEFFPYRKKAIEEFQYCREMSVYSMVQWETELVEFGKNGQLFHAGYKYSNDGLTEGVNLMFWVTKDTVYWLNGTMDDDDKTKLLRYGDIPSYATIVCSEKAVPDSLSDNQKGTHEMIEKHPDGIRWYRRYDLLTSTGLEGRNCYTMIWKKGIGLVGYQYKYTASGGRSIQAWNPKFVEPYDVGYRLME